MDLFRKVSARYLTYPCTTNETVLDAGSDWIEAPRPSIAPVRITLTPFAISTSFSTGLAFGPTMSA
jgi:hypothetical protein